LRIAKHIAVIAPAAYQHIAVHALHPDGILVPVVPAAVSAKHAEAAARGFDQQQQQGPAHFWHRGAQQQQEEEDSDSGEDDDDSGGEQAEQAEQSQAGLVRGQKHQNYLYVIPHGAGMSTHYRSNVYSDYAASFGLSGASSEGKSGTGKNLIASPISDRGAYNELIKHTLCQHTTAMTSICALRSYWYPNSRPQNLLKIWGKFQSLKKIIFEKMPESVKCEMTGRFLAAKANLRRFEAGVVISGARLQEVKEKLAEADRKARLFTGSEKSRQEIRNEPVKELLQEALGHLLGEDFNPFSMDNHKSINNGEGVDYLVIPFADVMARSREMFDHIENDIFPVLQERYQSSDSAREKQAVVDTLKTRIADWFAQCLGYSFKTAEFDRGRGLLGGQSAAAVSEIRAREKRAIEIETRLQRFRCSNDTLFAIARKLEEGTARSRGARNPGPFYISTRVHGRVKTYGVGYTSFNNYVPCDKADKPKLAFQDHIAVFLRNLVNFLISKGHLCEQDWHLKPEALAVDYFFVELVRWYAKFPRP
jgi:hypothetical protein